MDSLNKLMANKEELVKVLERHIVPGVRMEGKEVPDGATKLRSASGDEDQLRQGQLRQGDYCHDCRHESSSDPVLQVTTPAGSAFIVKFDFIGKNGVYHAVDQVL